MQFATLINNFPPLSFLAPSSRESEQGGVLPSPLHTSLFPEWDTFLVLVHPLVWIVPSQGSPYLIISVEKRWPRRPARGRTSSRLSGRSCAARNVTKSSFETSSSFVSRASVTLRGNRASEAESWRGPEWPCWPPGVSSEDTGGLRLASSPVTHIFDARKGKGWISVVGRPPSSSLMPGQQRACPSLAFCSPSPPPTSAAAVCYHWLPEALSPSCSISRTVHLRLSGLLSTPVSCTP